MAVGNLAACVDMRTKIGDILLSASHLTQAYTEQVWTKVKKAMKAWRTPPDFWIAIEKGINHYAARPLKRD
jgi:hypothetical protein